MTYYHLTDEQKVPLILKNGLIPSCGNNSILAEDFTECVYLTDRASVEYWSALLSYSTVMEVDYELSETEDICRTYEGGYTEIKIAHPISPNKVKYAFKIVSISNNTMFNVYASQLRSLKFHFDRLTCWCDEDDEPVMEFYLNVLKRLDASVVTQELYEDTIGCMNLGKIRSAYDNIKLSQLCDYLEATFERFTR